MARSNADTVEEYLSELPEHRREVVGAMRKLLLRYLPPGYQEAINWGMISYEVPLDRFPDTYNGQPLMYVALAAQKKHYALYLTTVYWEGESELEREFEKAGKKLDMGKACVRFRRMEDLPLEVIGEVVARTPVDDFIRLHEESRRRKG